jgi:predicted ATPase
MFSSIKLTNFLSFGEASAEIPLGKLNVLVGTNGSGKSNLLEAFALLKATPTDLLSAFSDGSGIRDWLWKSGASALPVAELEVVLNNSRDSDKLRYGLKFTEARQRFRLEDEILEYAKARDGGDRPYFFYHFENGRGVINVKGRERRLQEEQIDIDQSILAQRKDPESYPELTRVGSDFGKIHLYRDWSFGRNTAPRLPQKADLRNEYLSPKCENLVLVLNRLCGVPATKKLILDHLKALYEGIDDLSFQIEGGTVQLFLTEGMASIPATRLSDGTLRYLCLLAILCHPSPPPIICIEEPELGLHPDILPKIAELLLAASEKCQIIVTTHSDSIIDALTERPETVLVTERHSDKTTISRLETAKLKTWLETYRLGQLWTRGDLGGTRW